MNDNDKSLKEVCEMIKVSRRVIQGYEDAGLIKASGKNKYGYLLYDKSTTERITNIRLYQKMGFQLKEIKEFIDKPEAEIKEVLEERQVYLQRKIEQLEDIQSVVEKIINNDSKANLKKEILQVIKEEI